jgi:peptidoglycan/xylan/chitin deacetylase (PgdA/CDA1 family)
MIASAAMGAPVARATSGPQPAFYTFQAPGGAGTAGQRVVALTFDDGPGTYTPQVLSVLEQYRVPATFFEVGAEAAAYPQYTRMVAAAGYPVEDHTWSHPDLTTIPLSEFPLQIDQTQSEIQSLTGMTPACVRPPYDAWNSTVLSQIGQRGLTTMSYSVDPRDWTTPGTQVIVQNVLNAAFPGAVIGLHDGGGNRSQTVAALPQIISGLEARGYGFVSICGSLPTREQSAVYPFGNAPAPGTSVVSNQPLLGMAATPSGQGYWLVASDGGIFSFGDATFDGSTGSIALNKPIVGMAATPSGQGYWLVASDGGIFSFGDALFVGSMGGVPLNQPIVSMADDPQTGGYWLLASDGGVFSFQAPFYGSRGGQSSIDRFFAIVATAGGGGYLLGGSRPAA